MNSSSRISFAVFVLAAFTLSASAQPTPAKPGPANPGGGPVLSPSGPPSFGPPAPLLSPVLAGIISTEEFNKYTAFQKQLNDDPALKELNAKITGHIKELQRLQVEASTVREKLIATNPEIKAIRDKIMSAGHARTGAGPGPMPMPVPVPAKNN